MTRVVIVVLDSFAVGSTPDAVAYGDAGANTLGHIVARCAEGNADRSGARRGPLRLPTLASLGLFETLRAAGRGDISPFTWTRGAAGCAAERSRGKDSQSGHWEIAGTPVPWDWGYFREQSPCFPPWLLEQLCERCGLPGTLGNRHASGTQILEELGNLHLETGKPICYTSGDSVFQIAAHEAAFGLDRLYAICTIARSLVDELRIGRVIARPFTGFDAKTFVRTPNRRDYGVDPPPTTLLNRATEAGRDVISVGKIGDLFNHVATGTELKGDDNAAVFERLLDGWDHLGDGGLLFANLVDFDTLYGHRRDPIGYAEALEAFDRELPRLLAKLMPGDLCVVTGDHGCDPTWPGTNHTREYVPILAFAPHLGRAALGRRKTFADIGATVAQHLRLPPLGFGRSFASRLHVA